MSKEVVDIINKYKDSNGYILDFDIILDELIEKEFDTKVIEDCFLFIMDQNKIILDKVKTQIDLNKKLEEEKSNALYIDYEKEVVEKSSKKNYRKERVNNSDFYYEYIIENLENDMFLNILPKDASKESKDILDLIIARFLKEATVYEGYLFETEAIEDINYINSELVNIYYVITKIKEYKNNLSVIKQSDDFNKVVFYMENGEANVFRDCEDLESKKIVLELIESIKNNRFQNIKSFNNNDKLRKIFEVRNLSKRVRVLFEIKDDAYVIICSIINKTDSNSKYKENIINQVKRYRENQTISQKKGGLNG